MGFFRLSNGYPLQYSEYWSGKPFPSPGDLPNPGIEPRSLALQAEFLVSETSLCLQSDIVKTMVFPVVMYRCESWTIKKVEHQRTDAFKLWCGEYS